MAIGEEELIQECSPEHLRMGTARMKCTVEDGKHRRVNMETGPTSAKKISHHGLTVAVDELPNEPSLV